MEDTPLERVKELAQKLSPEDRKQLFNFIVALPDSGIATGTVDPPSPLLSPEDRKTVEESAVKDTPIIVFTETYASIFLKGRPIFTLYFYPMNFRQSRLEVPSWKDALPSDKVKEEIRRAVTLVSGGKRTVTDDEIIESTKRRSLEMFEAVTFGISTGISHLLPNLVLILFEGGNKVIELGHQNRFADRTGQRKKTLEEMVKELEPFWKLIKEMLNVTPGGRQNVRHVWSPTDLICLDVHYERLKPIWREAKKAVRAALKSNETTRRKRWKEEVRAIYAEESLPDDLIEHLAPSQETPPADLALEHAGRLCLPDVIPPYSLKVLKEKLRELKRPARTSLDSSENEGSSITPE